jgi:hypothetical protein
MIFARPFGAGFFSAKCKVISAKCKVAVAFCLRQKAFLLRKFKKIVFFCKKLYTNGKKSGKIIIGILLKRS